MFTLENKDLVLTPGEYVFMVDPIWNKFADNDKAYRDVLIDIYGPESTMIRPVENIFGQKLLTKALKHAAMTKVSDSEKVKYIT